MRLPGGGRDRLRRLRRHEPPGWWRDARLGIFIHWTPASVPGWAPTDSDVAALLAAGRRDALAETPYTEWYENSLRFPDSSVSRHHHEVWGQRPYAEFAADFEDALDGWDPDSWARAFAGAGARYVVLVSKHHDGWCLWPSAVANPHRPGWGSRRDIVGELREAVLGAGMRFGLYYSGGLDWTFDDHPIGTLADLVAAVPRGRYPAYAAAQLRELVERYRPSVLWNDIAWPAPGRELWPLLEEYYDAVPDGVVNDRWMPYNPGFAALRNDALRSLADRIGAASARRGSAGTGGVVPPRPPVYDYRTPEYTVFDHVPGDPWECVRGMDGSFGYNRNSAPSDFLGHDELVAMAADIAAKGGNLLLNVGPRGEDATIPDEQLDLLATLGAWASGDGRSAFGARPWVRPEGRSADGRELRFWSRGDSVFVAVGPAAGNGGDGELRIDGLGVAPGASASDAEGREVAIDGDDRGVTLRWRQETDWQVVELRKALAAPLR